MKRGIAISILWLCYIVTYAQIIDINNSTESFEHYWSEGTCAGRVNEGLRTSWVEQLKLVKDNCGFNYLRMHGLFDDDMCICFPQKDGSMIYNWQYVDEVHDRMLDLGVRPFVELSFFPKDIAAPNSKIQMWYQNRVTPDEKTFSKWHDLVKAFVQHEVDRYGIEEVRKWYFEVWNEPNLTNGFFDGTRSQYFELYKQSALAVKSVDPLLKVGGPATSNFIADRRHEGEIYDHKKSVFYSQDQINKQQWKGVWIEDFLKFCAKENLPVDFISCHPYPTDYALDPESGRSKDAIRYVNSVRDDIAWLQKTIKNSKYPEAEIHLTEWSTSPNSRDVMHDLLPPAAYITKVTLDCIGMTNSLMYWTFTDIFEEKGGGQEIFHGGFGMINFQGIVKPSFHAFRMLNQLGDTKIYYKEPLFVSKDSKTGKVSAIAFNYPVEYHDNVPSSKVANDYMNNVSSKSIDCSLVGLKPNSLFEIEILDKDHGNAYDEWVRMGKPHSPNRQETQHLKDYSWATSKNMIRVDSNGVLNIKMELQPWSVVLIKEL